MMRVEETSFRHSQPIGRGEGVFRSDCRIGRLECSGTSVLKCPSDRRDDAEEISDVFFSTSF